MLVITADDYGKTKHATESIIECSSRKRITSTSAMVFMEDSNRAASIVPRTSLEVGLHLNFTTPFSSTRIPWKLREHQNRVISYLSKANLSQVIYSPSLSASFDFLFFTQQAEFLRLYGRCPDFYNGHHHMHLCTNLLASMIIPKGTKVRRTFTHEVGERNLFNRFYRHILDVFVSKRYISTDSFFSIAPIQNQNRLRRIINRSERETVEIVVHPESPEEMVFLLSDEYKYLIASFNLGCFKHLI